MPYVLSRSENRGRMPVARKWAYFDHAAVAPLPETTQRSIAEWAAQASADGDTCWPAWHRRVESTRQMAAQLISADESEVALVHSTTEGIGLVAEGVEQPWQAEYVAARHCTELQGFLFSRPLPAEAVPEALARSYPVPRAISASAAIHSGDSLRQLRR